MGDTAQIITVLVDMGIPHDKAAYAAARYSDAERALNWCFEGGADWTPDQPQGPFIDPLVPSTLMDEGSADKPIDMTLAGEDDEELRQALAQSLGEGQGGSGPSGQTGWGTPVGPQDAQGGMVTFGPSTKEGTNQNALVSTAGWETSPPPFSTSNEDKEMNEAMFASFHDSLPGSDTVFTPRTAGPRAPGAPLALYNPDPGMAFATALLQGLFALSSFREILAFSYPDPLPTQPQDSPLIWLDEFLRPKSWDELQDLARVTGSAPSGAEAGLEDKESVLVGVELGGLWPRARRGVGPEDPGRAWFIQLDELTSQAVGSAIVQSDPPPPKLLQELKRTPNSPLEFFNFWTVQPLAPDTAKAVQSIFTIHCASSASNSLHKAISRDLWPGGADDAKFAIAASGPHVLSVFLTWPKTVPYGGRVTFDLDETVYVDRYLQRNFQQVFRLRASEGVLKAEEEELIARRAKVTTVKGKDVRSHLVNVISYYESLAKPVEDAALQERSGQSLAKLQSVLSELDAEIARIDERVKDVQVKRQGLFDGPDFRKHPLELKAVLMHNGLHTAGAVYAYVRHGDKWWCVSDGRSTEVTWATAKADKSGLHLGAGPWCLLYERGSGWIDVEEPKEPEAAAAPVADETQPMDEDPATGLATPPPEEVVLDGGDAPGADEMLGVESPGRKADPHADKSQEETRLEDRERLGQLGA